MNGFIYLLLGTMDHKFCEHGSKKREPLRQYCTHKPSKDYTGRSFLEHCMYILAPLFVLLLIVALGVYATLLNQRKQSIHLSEQQQNESFMRGDGSVSCDLFLASYLNTKGFEIEQAGAHKLKFRGTYARGDEMVAFFGETDLSGNGSVEFGWSIDHSRIDFLDGLPEKDLGELMPEDDLAINTLCFCLRDPLLEYRTDPANYTIQMDCKLELGREVVDVELVNKTTMEVCHLIVDVEELNIVRLERILPSAKISLRYYGYHNTDGLTLPSKIIASNAAHEILPIYLSELRQVN